MHIIYLHQYFVPPDGMGGTRSYEIGKRLVKEGHQVTLITSHSYFPPHYEFTKPVSELDMEGINLKVIKVPYSNNMSYPRRIMAFVNFALRATQQVISSGKADLIFATSTPLTIAIPGILGKLSQKCPMVLEIRDLWPELPVAVGALKNPLMITAAEKLELTAYRNSAAIIALSPGMKEGIARKGYPSSNVTVIPNSCDIDIFDVPESRGNQFLEAHSELKGKALITYAGTMGIINGVEYLVEIAKEMLTIEPEVKFTIFGEGKEKGKVISRARKLGVLQRNLWIYPPLPKSQMPSLLSATTMACSLFIDLPEMWNNSANKFFDALASRTPVMINYKGWQETVLNETGAGLAVPHGAPREAALLALSFINDSLRYEKAIRACDQLARGRFNRDVLFEKLNLVLEKAVSRK